MTNVWYGKSYAWLKESFKVQDNPMDFNVIEYIEFTNMASDYTLKLTFKILVEV